MKKHPSVPDDYPDWVHRMAQRIDELEGEQRKKESGQLILINGTVIGVIDNGMAAGTIAPLPPGAEPATYERDELARKSRTLKCLSCDKECVPIQFCSFACADNYFTRQNH